MVTKRKKLERSFFQKGKVENIAPKLLGKILKTKVDGIVCSGKIVEVEAYCGLRDRACHAYFGKTDRNKIMFEQGAIAYVYLCYGLHHLFNIVVGQKGNPAGVLIRALEPIDGIETMRARRHYPKKDIDIANGPGKLSQAMGIDLRHYGLSIGGSEIWIESGEKIGKNDILVGPRIGVDYAGEDKDLPWRFALNSPYALLKGMNKTP